MYFKGPECELCTSKMEWLFLKKKKGKASLVEASLTLGKEGFRTLAAESSIDREFLNGNDIQGPRNLFKHLFLPRTPNAGPGFRLDGAGAVPRRAPRGGLAEPRPAARAAEFSVFTFPPQAAPTSFLAHRPHPPPARVRGPHLRGVPCASPGTKRRRIPVGPRGAKSARQDGKLQKSPARGPPPRLSRNSRPSVRTPQLIHSRERGRLLAGGSTDVRARHCAAEAPALLAGRSARGVSESPRPASPAPRAASAPPALAAPPLFPRPGAARRGEESDHLAAPAPRRPCPAFAPARRPVGGRLSLEGSSPRAAHRARSARSNSVRSARRAVYTVFPALLSRSLPQSPLPHVVGNCGVKIPF